MGGGAQRAPQDPQEEQAPRQVTKKYNFSVRAPDPHSFFRQDPSDVDPNALNLDPDPGLCYQS